MKNLLQWLRILIPDIAFSLFLNLYFYSSHLNNILFDIHNL